ncbi:hypothetical protein STANM309S_02602 [Streptomyces tanashiensis]
MTAPNGMETSAARMVTLATNQNCSMNSRNWKGRRKTARLTSAARAKRRPVCRSAPVITTAPGGRHGQGGRRGASRVGVADGGAGCGGQLVEHAEDAFPSPCDGGAGRQAG